MYSTLTNSATRLCEKVERILSLYPEVLDTDDVEELQVLTVETRAALQICKPPDNPWIEDRWFPRIDWLAEVDNSSTLLGYWAWVFHRKESATHWKVTCGNIGMVHENYDDEAEARIEFKAYADRSKQFQGRAGGEAVALWKNGEPVEEYHPPE